MPGQGLQKIPLRIPDKWDADWYARHIREVLALADTRNSIEGSGITISGQPGEVATISASDDLQNLLLQSYVLASPSGFLNFERVLDAGDGIEIIDGGANSTIAVGIEDRGINLGKLAELSNAGILGNPVDAVGAVQNINPEQTLAVLHYTTADGIVFDLIDHTYVSDFDEAAQDAVGGIVASSSSVTLTYSDGTPSITAAIVDEYVQDLMASTLTDSTGVDFVYDDLTGTILANLNFANPSGLIGMSAVNGAAATPLRSDARHAIDPAIAPSWTGTHTWINSAPTINFTESDQGTDEKNWQIRVQSKQFLIQTTDDAVSAAKEAINILRATGSNAVTSISFGNTTDAPENIFRGRLSIGNAQTTLVTNIASPSIYAASGSGSGDFALAGTLFIQPRSSAARDIVIMAGSTSPVERMRIVGASAQVRMQADNLELQIGAGNDLRLYHDGSNSFIHNTTGRLNLGGSLVTASPDLVNFPSAVVSASACLSVGKDSIGGATVDIATFAGNLCGIRCYSANGGVGALAAVTVAANPLLAFLGGAGYDGTNWTGSAALIGLRTGSNWTASNYETYASVEVTPSGSTARAEVGRFDGNSTAGNTRFMVYDVDNATLERVSVGPADSGGTGFKLLRIAN